MKTAEDWLLENDLNPKRKTFSRYDVIKAMNGFASQRGMSKERQVTCIIEGLISCFKRGFLEININCNYEEIAKIIASELSEQPVDMSIMDDHLDEIFEQPKAEERKLTDAECTRLACQLTIDNVDEIASKCKDRLAEIYANHPSKAEEKCYPAEFVEWTIRVIKTKELIYYPSSDSYEYKVGERFIKLNELFEHWKSIKDK